MADQKRIERSMYVQGMFDRIATAYDLMNRLMTAGQDITWRREVIQRSGVKAGSRILDIGIGTGDLAREALFQQPDCQVIGVDFSREMMSVGRKKIESDASQNSRLIWVAADANRLPFKTNSFDAIISGFLLRNLSSVEYCLAEQFRLLKSGGKLVTLDTTPLGDSILAPFIRFHLHTVIPALGTLISKQQDAYKYLPNTTEDFLKAEILAERLRSAGFEDVGFHRLMLGSVAIHWGCKR